jgi:protein-L-isoaspartate O-methyltransferase
MKKRSQFIITCACLLASLLSCESKKERIFSAPRAQQQEARKILDATGVEGGLIVHIGCGDGKLTAALRANDRYTVHGLEADPARVAEARRYIQAQGIYGPVSVERYSGSVLPYTDNLINLIVVQDMGKVPRDEVMRVLAPGGVAYFQRNGRGGSRTTRTEKVVKAWPDNIDQWTHFLRRTTSKSPVGCAAAVASKP